MASQLTDNFNDNSIDAAKWDVNAIADYNAGVTVAETGQQLVITPLSSTAGSNRNGLISDSAFNLTQGYAIWKLEQAASGGAETRCGVYLDASNYCSFEIASTTLRFRKRDAGTNSDTTTTYNSTNHKYLMLHRCGTIWNWYTSADAVTWTIQRSGVTTTFAVTALKEFFDAGTIGSVASPGTAIFDDVDLGQLDLIAPFEQLAAFGGYVDLVIDPGFPLSVTPGATFTIPTARSYSGSRLFTTLTNLLVWRQEIAGTIKEIDLYMGVNDAASTQAIFNIRKNGTRLLADSGRLIVNAGASSSLKTGLALTAAVGDLMALEIEQCPSTGIPGPIYIVTRTEVG